MNIFLFKLLEKLNTYIMVELGEKSGRLRNETN